MSILALLLLVGSVILFFRVIENLLGHTFIDIFAIIFLILILRYGFFPNKTTKELIEVVKEAIKSFFSTTLRILIAAPFIIFIVFIIWLIYTALTSGMDSDVCFFITSNDCL